MREAMRPLFLRAHGRVDLIEADDLVSAISAVLQAGGVDLAILDLKIPGMNDLAGLSRFRMEFPAIRVAVMAEQAEAATVLAAMEAGAAGVIPKTIGRDSFVSIIRLLLTGERYVPCSAFLDLSRGATPPVASGAGTIPAEEGAAEEAFTSSEHDFMTMLVAGQANKAIAHRLGFSEPTVKSRLRQLYRKLGASNRTQAVAIILAHRHAKD